MLTIPKHWAGFSVYEAALERLTDRVKSLKTLESIAAAKEFLRDSANLKMIISELPPGVWKEITAHICPCCGNSLPCYCCPYDI